MSRMYQKVHYPDGEDVVTAIEINRELQEISGEINGRLDRENFGSRTLTAAKLASGAITLYGAMQINGSTGAITITAPGGSSIATPLPGATATDYLEGTMTCNDGFLVLRLAATFDDLAAVPRNLTLGLEVDGRLVATSGPTMTTNGGAGGSLVCANTHAYVPVGAGAHTFRAVLFSTAPGDYSCRSRQLLVRHERR